VVTTRPGRGDPGVRCPGPWPTLRPRLSRVAAGVAREEDLVARRAEVRTPSTRAATAVTVAIEDGSLLKGEASRAGRSCRHRPAHARAGGAGRGGCATARRGPPRPDRPGGRARGGHRGAGRGAGARRVRRAPATGRRRLARQPDGRRLLEASSPYDAPGQGTDDLAGPRLSCPTGAPARPGVAGRGARAGAGRGRGAAAAPGCSPTASNGSGCSSWCPRSPTPAAWWSQRSAWPPARACSGNGCSNPAG